VQHDEPLRIIPQDLWDRAKRQQREVSHPDRALLTDVDEARASLRQLLGPVVLQPIPEGLVAELRGNIQGLLVRTGEQASVVGNTGNGGPLCTNRTP
jgi:hypothetical protein